MCVCVCFRLPVCTVCLNHEVVVFQPRTETAPELRSVANYTFIITLPPHLFQPVFWVFSFPPSMLLAPIRSVCCRFPYHLNPLPTSSPSAKRRPLGRRPHLPPASLRISSLRLIILSCNPYLNHH